MEIEQSILIIEITNNNHLSNVKSLQSIFKQDYLTLELAILNDDTDAFQCERLIYNITDHTPTNYQRVRIVENPYPMGETASVRKIVAEMCPNFVFVLHAGERFASPEALTACIKLMEKKPDAGILIAPLEERTPDLRTVVKKHVFSRSRLGRETTNRDSMLIYRGDTLRNLLRDSSSSDSLCDLVCAGLSENKLTAEKTDAPICMFTQKEIKDESVELPTTLGNGRLQNIERLARVRAANPSATRSAQPARGAAAPSQKNKRILWLFKNSRFLRIKTNILIDLLLIFFAVLFFTEEIFPPSWIAFAACAVVLTLWIFTMLSCNLYFRKHPERLVF